MTKMVDSGQPVSVPAHMRRWTLGLVVCAVGACLSLTAAQAPAAPSGLSAFVDADPFFQTSVRVSLAWDAPSSDPVPTGYLVEVGSAPGLKDLVNTFTSAEDAFVTTRNVSPGVYYARVRAVNGDAVSGPSNEVTVTTQSWSPYNLSAPASPAVLDVAMSGMSATVSWQDGRGRTSSAPPASSYIVRAGTSPGMNDLGEIDTRGATSLSVPQVPTGTYYVTVLGWNSSGRGLAAPPVGLIVSPSCSYVLKNSVDRFPALGGGGGVVVTTSESTCPWTATSDRPWIVLHPFIGSGGTSQVSSVGNGYISYRAAVVESPSRTGFIKFRGVDREIALFVTQ